MAGLVREPAKQVEEPVFNYEGSFVVPDVEEDWEDDVPKHAQFQIPSAEKLAELKRELQARKAARLMKNVLKEVEPELEEDDGEPPELEMAYVDVEDADDDEFVPGKIVTPDEIAMAMMIRVPGAFDGVPCISYEDYFEQCERIADQRKFLLHKTLDEPGIDDLSACLARLELSLDSSIPLWRRMGFVRSSVVWASAEAELMQQRILDRYLAYRRDNPFCVSVSKFVVSPVPAFPKPGPKCEHDPYEFEQMHVCSGTDRELVTLVREPGNSVPVLKTYADVKYSKSISVKRLELTTTVEKLIAARKERDNLHIGKVQVDQTRQALTLDFHFCAVPSDPVTDNGEIDVRHVSRKYTDNSEHFSGYCWSGMNFHPLRLPGMPADVTYLPWEDWPYYLTRNHVLPKNALGKIHYFPYRIYHFCRTEFCEEDVVCLNVLNLDVHKIVHVIVPRECGPRSVFHRSVELQKPDVFLLALNFGLNVNRGTGISKGVDMFFKGVTFGRHSICELYVGNCPICDVILCHLDVRHSCVRCYTCKKYFASKKYLDFHKACCRI